MAPGDIAFYAIVFFLLGVFFASLGFSVYRLIVVLAIVSAGIFIIKRSWLPEVLTGAAIIFSGIFYFNFYLNAIHLSENIPLNSPGTFSGIIASEPQGGEKSASYDVKLLPPHNGAIRLITSLYPELNYGDAVKLEGTIEPRASITGNPSIFFPDVYKTGEHRGFWLTEKLISFKLFFTDQFKKFLSSDSAALAAGLTFGATSDFSNEFKSQMSLSGTTHIVALSGYNISIIVLAVSSLFGLWFRRKITFYLTILLIVLFVLMVGAGASVVRAAIMGFLLILAGQIGRLYSFRNAIAFAALFMVLLDPRVLVFNIGFQLSFASLLGIVYLRPAIESLLRLKKEIDSSVWRDSFLTTLSAQLAVMPILATSFGRVSFTALPANLLILVTVPYAMFLGFLLTGLSAVFSYIGFLFGWVLELLIRYQIWVIKFFAGFGLGAGDIFTNQIAVIIYYAVLITFVVNFYSKKRSKL